MSHPLLSLLTDQALDDLKQNMYASIRADMATIMEPAFAKAWDNAWARLSGAPVIPTQTPQTESINPEKSVATRSKPFGNAGNRAKWGASDRIIRQVFALPEYKGMTPAEMSEWSRANGEPVATASIRTTLKKMGAKHEVRFRKGKYFPRSPSGQTTRDESPAGDDPAPEDSRPNGSYMERPMPPP
jgi:hypothetical protein